MVDPLDLGVRLSHRIIPITIAAFSLATLSWWFVERPFRNATKVSWSRLVLFGALSVGIICGFSGYLLASGGAADRWSTRSQYLASFLDPNNQRSYDLCFLVETNQPFQVESCLPKRSGQGGVLLIGDSHAAHVAPGFRKQFADKDINLLMAVGCRNLGRDHVEDWSACARMRKILDARLASHRPELIVLSGRWREGDFDFLQKNLPFLRAHSQRVLLIGSQLEYDLAPPRVLAQQAQGIGDGLSSYRVTRFDGMQARLAEIARQSGADFIAPIDVLCKRGACLESVGDDPIYFDTDGHLTRQGAALFGQRVWPLRKADAGL